MKSSVFEGQEPRDGSGESVVVLLGKMEPGRGVVYEAKER